MQGGGVKIGGLLACALGAYLMASALFGHGWLVGERKGLDVRGGIIDAHLCSKPDDPDPMPLGIGDLEGCTSEMYGQSELRNEAGSFFGVATHMTLLFGGGAAGLFALFALLTALGLEIEVVPRTHKLEFHLFDLEEGAIAVHSHPGRLAASSTVTAGVALAMAVASAPASLSAGPDVARFVVGCLLAVAGGVGVDPLTLLPGGGAADPQPSFPGVDPETAAALAAMPPGPLPEAAALPEVEVAADDTPACVRCGGQTAWLEKLSRHRCQKCSLYQPRHAPGSQVDA